jgi:hypothetical protein
LFGAVVKAASINLRKLVLSPNGSINLGFLLREDLLLCSSYLPLGVPNWAVIYTPSVGNMCKYVGTQSCFNKQTIWVAKFIMTNFLGPNLVLGTDKLKLDQ